MANDNQNSDGTEVLESEETSEVNGYIPKNISDVRPIAQKITAQLPEAEQFAPILKHLKTNDIAESRHAVVAQKGTELAGEIADFSGNASLTNKIRQVNNFVTPRRTSGLEVKSKSLVKEENSQQVLVGDQKDINFVVKYRQVERITKLAEEVARLTGQEDVAEIIGALNNALETGKLSQKDLAEGDAGKIRKLLANSSGKVAGALANKKGFGNLSDGGSAALGGAVSGALAGEGAVGIGQNALSWYLVDAAIVSLLTPWSPLALLYLDIHYIGAKFGSKWFRMPSLWQRVTILFANFVYIFIIPVIIILAIYVACNSPTYSRIIGGATGNGTVGTVKGLVTGKSEFCKKFDISNLKKFGGGQPNGGGASSSY